jgi:hypothetical protein
MENPPVLFCFQLICPKKYREDYNLAKVPMPSGFLKLRSKNLELRFF